MAARVRARSRRLWWVLGVGVALLVVVGVAVWVATRPAPAKTEYDTVTVARTTVTEQLSLSGTINPQQRANAAFQVPGTISTVDVKVGDKVAMGARLATLDDQDLRDAVALADANAAAARASLTTVEDSASATDAQVTAARAQLRSAEASLTSAKNRLADAVLASPLAGTVAKVGYSVGDQVTGTGSATGGTSSSSIGGITLPIGTTTSTSGSIVVIATDAWQLDASVGTADLPSLKAGQNVTVTPTGTGAAARGVVDTVGVVATQTTGAAATFPVTVKISDTGGATLFAGSSADAVVITATHADVLTVPVAGVTVANGASTVDVIKGTGTEQRAVTLGRRFGGSVEILGGLIEGDQIRVAKAQVVRTSAPPAIFARTPSSSATPTS